MSIFRSWDFLLAQQWPNEKDVWGTGETLSTPASYFHTGNAPSNVDGSANSQELQQTTQAYSASHIGFPRPKQHHRQQSRCTFQDSPKLRLFNLKTVPSFTQKNSGIVTPRLVPQQKSWGCRVCSENWYSLHRPDCLSEHLIIHTV